MGFTGDYEEAPFQSSFMPRILGGKAGSVSPGMFLPWQFLSSSTLHVRSPIVENDHGPWAGGICSDLRCPKSSVLNLRSMLILLGLEQLLGSMQVPL